MPSSVHQPRSSVPRSAPPPAPRYLRTQKARPRLVPAAAPPLTRAPRAAALTSGTGQARGVLQQAAAATAPPSPVWAGASLRPSLPRPGGVPHRSLRGRSLTALAPRPREGRDGPGRGNRPVPEGRRCPGPAALRARQLPAHLRVVIPPRCRSPSVSGRGWRAAAGPCLVPAAPAAAPGAGRPWLQRSPAPCWVTPRRTPTRGERGRAEGQRWRPWGEQCRARPSVTGPPEGPGLGPKREVGAA